MPGGRSLAEDRVKTSKQLEMGHTGEEDRLGGGWGGCAGGCWKMSVGARAQPGGVPLSAQGIVVPAHGPQHAGRVAEMQRQEREGCNCHHRVGTLAPGLTAKGCAVLAAALRRSRREEGCCCWCQGHAREWERQISG